MSDIDRIRAAAAHPENWKPIKKSRRPSPLESLLTGWPTVQPAQLVSRPAREAIVEAEEKRHGK